MSDLNSTLSMLKCTYCGNYHNYSYEMCRDIHKSQLRTIHAPCDNCERLKVAEERAKKAEAERDRLREELEEARWLVENATAHDIVCSCLLCQRYRERRDAFLGRQQHGEAK